MDNKQSTGVDRTRHHTGGVGGMTDCGRGDRRGEGSLRPPRARRDGGNKGRKGGKQEPMVPTSQGDGCENFCHKMVRI